MLRQACCAHGHRQGIKTCPAAAHVATLHVAKIAQPVQHRSEVGITLRTATEKGSEAGDRCPLSARDERPGDCTMRALHDALRPRSLFEPSEEAPAIEITLGSAVAHVLPTSAAPGGFRPTAGCCTEKCRSTTIPPAPRRDPTP